MNTQLGYYIVGSKKFTNKIDALIESKNTKLPIRWNFFDTIFGKVDWTHPKRTDIRTLYKRRALQLRQKYDYLILYFSGGVDSTTALLSFVNNGIKLDEVFVKWPIKASEQQGVSYDTSAENTNNEWNLTIKPRLEWLKSNHPHVKITTLDITDKASQLENNLSVELLKSLNGHYINFGATIKLTPNNNEIKLLEKGVKVASIVGTDKPLLCKIKNQIFVYFTDRPMGNLGSIDDKFIEPFYWTPDMPEIVLEQSHLILEYMKVNPSNFELIEEYNLKDIFMRFAFERFVKPLIYPDWNNETFQVNKDIGINPANDSFLMKNEISSAFDKWKSLMKDFLTDINKDYINFNGNNTIIKGLSSPLYKIATI